MRKGYERGSFIEWLLMLLAISVVIFGILIPKSGREFFVGLPNLGDGWMASQDSAGGAGFPSVFSEGAVRLGSGNARNSGDPMDEYITLDNLGSRALDITGWRLENDRGSRAQSVGGQTLYYASDTAIIPQGTKVISPSGRNVMERIILKPGERAIITSGGPGNVSPYKVVSFKENSCTGYLNKDYRFSGGLDKSCVRPGSEIGVSSLENQCRDFISGLQSCYTPTIGGLDNQGRNCQSCVDGRDDLSNSCISFIKSHYTYAGCLINHLSDANFEGTTWHVYLYRPWEMWASSYETMYLYDASGNLVTKYSY